MKTCKRCGKKKPLDEFGVRPSVKKGLVPRSYCKLCDSEVATNARNTKKANDPEGFKRADRLSARNRSFERYGVTPEQVNEMGEAQEWKCGICSTDILAKPYIDHDHATGIARQLLCFHCNVGLGHFFDSTDLLEKAIAYLNKHTKEKIDELRADDTEISDTV